MVKMFDETIGKDVEITQKDIECSERRNVATCALSTAVRRFFGDDSAIVYTYPSMIGIGPSFLINDDWKYITLENEIVNWRKIYDSGIHTVLPFKMRLERLDNGESWGMNRYEYIFRMVV